MIVERIRGAIAPAVDLREPGRAGVPVRHAVGGGDLDVVIRRRAGGLDERGVHAGAPAARRERFVRQRLHELDLLGVRLDVLRDLDANEKPRVTALNKVDLLDDPSDVDLSLYPNAVPVSALKQVGLDALREKIAQVLAESMEMVQVTIPYAKSELVELFHRRGHVDQEEHRPDGTFIAGRIPRLLQGYYMAYLDF